MELVDLVELVVGWELDGSSWEEPEAVQLAGELRLALDEATGGAHPCLHFTAVEDACDALQWIVDVPLRGTKMGGQDL